jgi:hypothetical protein
MFFASARRAPACGAVRVCLGCGAFQCGHFGTGGVLVGGGGRRGHGEKWLLGVAGFAFLHFSCLPLGLWPVAAVCAARQIKLRVF